jgi:hypothetical protein
MASRRRDDYHDRDRRDRRDYDRRDDRRYDRRDEHDRRDRRDRRDRGRRSSSGSRSPAPRPKAAEKKNKKRAKWDVDDKGQTTGAGAAAGAGTGMAQLQAMQQQAMQGAMLQQQAALTRKARRLHVSNLPPGITEEILNELFNTTMQAAKLTLHEEGCVNGVQMASDGRYAFIEFRSVSETNNAIVIDGIELMGKAMRCAARPPRTSGPRAPTTPTPLRAPAQAEAAERLCAAAAGAGHGADPGGRLERGDVVQRAERAQPVRGRDGAVGRAGRDPGRRGDALLLRGERPVHLHHERGERRARGGDAQGSGRGEHPGAPSPRA